jgi:Protein of unknown function (DUF2934)
MQNLDEAIRERAYHLWIADGRPDGKADAYWLDAQREILTVSFHGRADETADTDSASVAAKPAKKAKAAGSRKSKVRAA